MSWDAELVNETFNESVFDVNMTHNVNPMIREAAKGADVDTDWWNCFDGMGSSDSAVWLSKVIAELESKPTYYRCWDPPNGWGSYDSLLDTLRAMHKATVVFDGGRWRVTG